MKIKQYALVLITMLCISTVQAELYLEGAYEGGGEDLAVTTFGDSISAGGGLKFSLGIQNSLGNGSSTFRISAGYMFDSLDVYNGVVETSAVTIDAMYTIHSGVHSLGIGGTMHLAPEYEETFLSGSFAVEFDDAVGMVFQYGYHFPSGMEFGVRYTDLTYEVNSIQFDAGGLGIFISNGF